MGKIILFIEDNEDIRESAAELLALQGFDVITANGGKEALRIIAENLPDLIICDIVMSGMDGFSVYEAVKNDLRTSSVPFVFSTARIEKEDRQKAQAIGVNDYLIKPFSDQELLNSINKCLSL